MLFLTIELLKKADTTILSAREQQELRYRQVHHG